jgi:hypothetical protein
METPRDADFRLVEYTVEGLGADGRWKTVAKQTANAGDTEKRSGAPFSFGGLACASANGCRQIRVRVRVGDFLALDPAMPEDTRWKRTISFRPFSPPLSSAIDLVPE